MDTTLGVRTKPTNNIFVKRYSQFHQCVAPHRTLYVAYDETVMQEQHCKLHVMKL